MPVRAALPLRASVRTRYAGWVTGWRPRPGLRYLDRLQRTFMRYARSFTRTFTTVFLVSVVRLYPPIFMERLYCRLRSPVVRAFLVCHNVPFPTLELGADLLFGWPHMNVCRAGLPAVVRLVYACGLPRACRHVAFCSCGLTPARALSVEFRTHTSQPYRSSPGMPSAICGSCRQLDRVAGLLPRRGRFAQPSDYWFGGFGPWYAGGWSTMPPALDRLVDSSLPGSVVSVSGYVPRRGMSRLPGEQWW